MELPLVRATPFYPGQWGIPGSDNSLGLRTVPQAKVFYVDPSDPLANDSNDGTLPAAPLVTIQQAVDNCTSGNGDHIVVMPGTYDEDIVITKDYITLMGALPGGYARPDLVGNVGVALTVHGQGFYCKHVRVAAVAGQTAVIQQGNGYVYEDCVFDGDGALVMRLLPDLNDDSYTASEGLITKCLFRGGTDGITFANPGPSVPPGSGAIGCTDVQIVDNVFYDQSSNAIADTDAAGSNDTTITNGLIHGNKFMTLGAAYVYINIAAGTLGSGLISGNYFNDADVVAAQIVTPALMLFVGNWDVAGIAAL
jgi:hypothetical protein